MKGPAAHFARALAQRVLILLVVFAAMPGGARAQTDLPQGAPSTLNRGFDGSVSVFEAYDGNLPLAVASIASSAGEVRGYSTMFMGDLHYDWSSSKVQVGMNAQSALRYQTEIREFQSLTHSAGFGLSSRLGQRSSLSLNQTASYSPSYLYGLFPSVDPVGLGTAPEGAPNYTTTDTPSYVYGTSATLTHNLSRRSTLSATSELQHTDFEQTGIRRDVTAYTFRGTYAYSLSRNSSFSTTYRFRTGDKVYGPATIDEPIPEWQETTEHGVEVGFTQNRQLSASRRAFFDVMIGSSTLYGLAVAPGDSGYGFRVSAQAEVGYQFARTWQVRGAYRRGVEYVVDLAEPAFLDGVTASLDGGLSRVVDLTALVSFSDGESAFTPSAYRYDTYTANVRLNWRWTDLVAMHSEYLYYYYDFGRRALLTPGVPPAAERNAARIGITVRLRADR